MSLAQILGVRDWPGAARLLADHSLSLTLDGQAQTIQALLRAFPPGADHPELALVRAMSNFAQGRLDEAAAHVAVAEAHAEATPPDRQRRLRVAIAWLKLSLARRRGHLASVIEQARFLASPVTGQSDEDIALGSDLRAVALMNLGTAEAWSLGLPDAERHLREGAALARQIGRPYLEVSCLAKLGFASKIHSFATTLREIGFDEAIDHPVGDFADQFAAATPDGIDVYFENVGGHVWAAVFSRLNPFARVPVCGLIAMYNEPGLPPGPDRTPALMSAILRTSLTIRGFIQTEFAADLMGEFLERATPWVRDGSLKHKEDIVDGLENAPEAFLGTLHDKNFGKLLVPVS